MGDPGGSSSLAAKLEHLFATVFPRARGRPYSPAEVAAIIEEQGGPSISGTYIWMLRHGRRTNPSMQVIGAIARAFGVPVEYFYDEETTRRVDEQLRLVAALSDAGVRDLATRAADLSPASRQAIQEMVNHVRRVEGVPDEDEDDHQPPPTKED